MNNELISKIIEVVKGGLIYGQFSQEEFAQVEDFFKSATSSVEPLPTLVDSQTAMSALHCDKHRLNYFLNKGLIKRVKFGHRKIMIDHESLRRFMTYGI